MQSLTAWVYRQEAGSLSRELSTVFFDPAAIPSFTDGSADRRGAVLFGEAILQQGLVPLYGLVTILLFCAIYLTYLVQQCSYSTVGYSSA